MMTTLIKSAIMAVSVFYCVSAAALVPPPHFGENTRVVRNLSEANAACYLYTQGHYQCNCLRIVGNEKISWKCQPKNPEILKETQVQSLVYLSAERCR